MSQTIQIEKISGIVKKAMLSLRWKVEKQIGEMQYYSVDTPLQSAEYGVVIDNIHVRMPENELAFIMPFGDSEKVCWDCGGQRMLELKYHIECGCMTWFDWCYNPQHERKKDA